MSPVKLLSSTIPASFFPLAAWGMLVAVLNAVFEAQSAELCAPAIALVVSVQGVVEFRRASERIWHPAFLGSGLCPGDMVRVRRHSRAALRLSNDTMLRLDQKTTLTLKGADDDKATLMEMVAGRLHLLTRTPKPFKVKTPFLNAGVEGTEFFIGLEPDEGRVVIYEGKVSASNEYGNLLLTDNEAAVVPRNQAPRKEVRVRPLDAVQWALHYPTIIDYRLGEKAGSALNSPALQAAAEHHRHGRLAEALSALDSIPQGNVSSLFLTYRAGLLLTVGRVDEAEADIQQAISLDPAHSDAYALRGIIAVVQNDKEQALVFAGKAIETDPASATARLALSYAEQAHFRIEDAIESVKKAVEFDPHNALVWARLAELHLSTGYLDRALEAARKAVDLNPNLTKTHIVLGFAHLAQIDTEAAKAAFAKAIELDQADPMPRLGMGLTKIREGDLEAGRVELEIAASLDPANSLVRSYLGKAYFEEKRYRLAATQFDLAKERDPNDPTPWLYDGIMKQTQNQPVEALRDIQKSIELNDNRAVYRSQLLLDQDQAARGSSLARIYDNLGFERRAIMETAKSLTLDPSNHSAHRFLSDAYLNTPRHEIARVSELLQAQLMQPININPVQPHLAVADLNIITGTGPTRTGLNEFAPLLERNKPQFVGSGIFGSRDTRGDEAVLSALYGRASVSVGQFHYHTDGFRKNNDQKHNVYNAFIQYVVTPKFNVQAEVRTRKSEFGDLLLDFKFRDNFNQYRNELQQDTARVGAKYSISPKQDFILSGIYTDRKEGQLQSGKNVTAFDKTGDQGYQLEAQYIVRTEQINLTGGVGTYQFNVARELITTSPFFSPDHDVRPDFKRERNNAYIYANVNSLRNISITLGLSYDSFKYDLDHQDAKSIQSFKEKSFDFNKIGPKLGFQWNVSPRLRLRLAWFENVKSALVANQSLEPTQVAGFNQLFDDINGTRARRMGAGLDAHLLNRLYGGVEVSTRDLSVPLYTPYRSLDSISKRHEELYRAYLYWLPHPHWTLRADLQLEKLHRQDLEAAGDPYRIDTFNAPLSSNYFAPSGVFAKVVGTPVWQHVYRQDSENQGVSNFFLLDAAAGFRLPKRKGIVSAEIRNILNEHFYFRNIGLQQSEQPLYNQRYSPDRTFFLRLTLNF